MRLSWGVFRQLQAPRSFVFDFCGCPRLYLSSNPACFLKPPALVLQISLIVRFIALVNLFNLLHTSPDSPFRRGIARLGPTSISIQSL